MRQMVIVMFALGGLVVAVPGQARTEVSPEVKQCQ